MESVEPIGLLQFEPNEFHEAFDTIEEISREEALEIARDGKSDFIVWTECSEDGFFITQGFWRINSIGYYKTRKGDGLE